MRSKLHSIAAIIFLAIAYVSNAQDIPPATSLVYPGIDGKLVYVADSPGNKIPDFSNAGYKGGGVPIPYVPVKATVWPADGIVDLICQSAETLYINMSVYLFQSLKYSLIDLHSVLFGGCITKS
jgi:hypothetical protein